MTHISSQCQSRMCPHCYSIHSIFDDLQQRVTSTAFTQTQTPCSNATHRGNNGEGVVVVAVAVVVVVETNKKRYFSKIIYFQHVCLCVRVCGWVLANMSKIHLSDSLVSTL